MLSKKMQGLLNDQIQREFYSSYLYLAMAAYLYEANFNGMANWMKFQAKEEWEHGMKIFNYLKDRGAQIILQTLEAPKASWKAPVTAFEDALKHEKKMTESINKLMDEAQAEKDHATAIFLQWYVTEQVEEEEQVADLIEKLKLVANAPGGLLILDRELANRA